jgi:hypothetical protein
MLATTPQETGTMVVLVPTGLPVTLATLLTPTATTSMSSVAMVVRVLVLETMLAATVVKVSCLLSHPYQC